MYTYVELEVEEVDLSSLVNDEISLAFSGKIVLWSGSVALIPAGWQLCDGTNGTPDLRNRFLVGAGDTFNPGGTGGATTHTHDFTANTHTHSHAPGSGLASGVNFTPNASDVASAGTTDTKDGRPPYYALAYIMKL